MDGNDLLEGGARSDSLLGGNGDDSLYVGALVDGDTNAGYQDDDDFDLADTMLGGDGADSMLGGTSGDSIEGGAGADSLYANNVANTSDGVTDNMWGNVNNDFVGNVGDTATGTFFQDKYNGSNM